MKSSIFVTALAMATSVFSAAVPQPMVQDVEKRQLESQLSVLDTLYAAVVEQTTQINATLAGAPSSPSLLDIASIAADINPRFAAITTAIVSATSSVTQRRIVLATRQDEEVPGETCDAECLTNRVLEVVYEIVSTIRGAIESIGLAPLLSRINPLLLALAALVTGLNVLVTGLLVTVTLVVTTVLGGLGLSLLLLGFA